MSSFLADDSDTTVIVVAFVSFGCLLGFACCSLALWCFIKSRRHRSVQGTEVVDINKHVKMQEAIVEGPHGPEKVSISLEEDLRIKDEIKRNETDMCNVAEAVIAASSPLVDTIANVNFPKPVTQSVRVPLRICQPTSCCAFGSSPHQFESISFPRLYNKSANNEVKLKHRLFLKPLICHPNRPKPILALNSDDPHQNSADLKFTDSFKQWDSLTGKFAGASYVPFLLLQLPQIILNARNLMAGNQAALFAVPWLGMFTGLLGNLSLLSYFIKKRETEAAGVQTLGVLSISVVACGLIINFMNYFNLLNPKIWRLWEDFITIAGVSALPQVMWSTFIPFVPNTILPAIISFLVAVTAVVMVRLGKLSEKGTKFVGSISGWTATLLFMWMPVSQMWTNILNPDNVKGLSAVSMLLAMIGNGLMIPRALFTRDLMWFSGSTWACVFYGWGNLICLYCLQCISREFFLAATIGFITWMVVTLWRDTVVYGYSSPLTSLKELVFGRGS